MKYDIMSGESFVSLNVQSLQSLRKTGLPLQDQLFTDVPFVEKRREEDAGSFPLVLGIEQC